MAKINFTKNDEQMLRSFIADSVLKGTIYNGIMGQTYTAYDLVNRLSISSLRSLSNYIQTTIVKLSITDEWIENPNAEEIAQLELNKKFVSLVIGWKLYQQEVEENAKEKARLTKQLNDLVEAQKSPEDLIAELRKRIEEL